MTAIRHKWVAMSEEAPTAFRLLELIRQADTIDVRYLARYMRARAERLRASEIRALEGAGLVSRQGRLLIATRRPEPIGPGVRVGSWTKSKILARIRAWNELTGHPPTKTEWNLTRLRQAIEDADEPNPAHLWALHLYKVAKWPSDPTVRSHCGSFTKAIRAAGLTPRRPYRQARIRPRPATAAVRRVYAGFVAAHYADDDLDPAELRNLVVDSVWS